MNDEGSQKANRDAPRHQPQKFEDREAGSGSAAGDDQSHGELQSQQSAGVVDQAFAFQNIDNAPGQPEALGNRGSGDGVGGGENRSQYSAQAIVKPGYQ